MKFPLPMPRPLRLGVQYSGWEGLIDRRSAPSPPVKVVNRSLPACAERRLIILSKRHRTSSSCIGPGARSRGVFFPAAADRMMIHVSHPIVYRYTYRCKQRIIYGLHCHFPRQNSQKRKKKNIYYTSPVPGTCNI